MLNLLLVTFTAATRENEEIHCSYSFLVPNCQDGQGKQKEQSSQGKELGYRVKEQKLGITFLNEFMKELRRFVDDSVLVVDESQLLNIVYPQQQQQCKNELPRYFFRYFALQRMFQKHLVTMSVEGIASDSSKKLNVVKIPDDQYHGECLSLILTMVSQGFEFDEPFVDSKYLPKDVDEKTKPKKMYIDDPDVECTVVRLRGLPWTSTEEDIREFFSALDIPKKGILLVLNFHGRSTGEAYVQFHSSEDCREALKKDRQNIGKRYIEIFPSSLEEMEKSRHIMDTELRELGNSTVIRMRGLPAHIKEKDIAKFFHPLKIEKSFIIDAGNPLSVGGGDAYVRFAEHKTLDEAMKRNKEKIGMRYIELFRSTSAEMKAAQVYIERSQNIEKKQVHRNHSNHSKNGFKRNRGENGKKKSNHRRQKNNFVPAAYVYPPAPMYPLPPPPQEASFSEHVVRLRGLPFEADEVDIADFFSELSIVDHGIHLIFNEKDMSSTGEAYIEFETAEDVEKAVKKHKQLLGKRYIEVFESSSDEMRKNCGQLQMNPMPPPQQYPPYPYWPNAVYGYPPPIPPNYYLNSNTRSKTKQSNFSLNSKAKDFVPSPKSQGSNSTTAQEKP